MVGKKDEFFEKIFIKVIVKDYFVEVRNKFEEKFWLFMIFCVKLKDCFR